MPGETSKPELPPTFNVIDGLARHPKAAIAIGAFCLWISVSLMLHMWFMHQRESFVKKLLWSFALLIPLFGWLFYGGCFVVPDRTDTPCSPSDGD